MKKNTMMSKLIMGLVVFMMLISITANFALAAEGGFKPGDIAITQPNETSGISNVAGMIIGTLQVIGVAISIIILIVIGLKYMTGSIEEKAEYKKTMIPYLVGAVLIFGASALAGVVFDFATSIGNATTGN